MNNEDSISKLNSSKAGGNCKSRFSTLSGRFFGAMIVCSSFVGILTVKLPGFNHILNLFNANTSASSCLSIWL